MFFAVGDPGAQDARVLLQGMRGHVLQGCTLLFSAVFPRFAVPEHDFHWQLAEKVRACSCDVRVMQSPSKGLRLLHPALPWNILRRSQVPISMSCTPIDVKGPVPNSRSLAVFHVCVQLGAACAVATGPAVTHVVAAQPNTDKALWARSCGKHVVSLAWLLESGAPLSLSVVA